MAEITLDVIGVHRLGKVRRMARIAIRILQLIIAVCMALRALQRCVRTREWEFRRGVAEG